MNYPLISEYIESIKASKDNFDKLNHLQPVLGEDGQPVMTSGNFAVVFKMKDEETGKFHAVKCFLKEQEGRAEAYRLIAEELEYVCSTFLTPIKYLDKELFVDTNASDEKEFPVLLMDWVEGLTLDKYIREHIDNQFELSLLAYQFSRLAMWLMPQPFAHGDLKPDNILVRKDGTLALVDYDGMYVPAMKGQKARELGSPNFRHPSRTENDFDEHIDDFSIVSILLSLKAISLQPELLEQYGASDRLLFAEKDYRNLSESQVMDALKTMMQDSELATLYSLFILASAQKNLSQASFSLLNLSRPQVPVVEVLSTEVTDEDIANAWTDEYGVMYSKDRKKLLRAPEHLISYIVKNGTKVICNKAFLNCNYYGSPTSCLQSIIIAKSVTTIGDYCFVRCWELSSVALHNGITNIGVGAFKDCKSLKTIQIPSSLNIIGDSAFRGCSNLYDVTIGCTIEILPYGIFSGCSNLTKIILPETIKKINDYAFYGCENLNTFSFPTKIREIGNFAFQGCESLTSVVIPEGVTWIGGSAFAYCTSLLQVSLPKSIQGFGGMYEWENRMGASESLTTTAFDRCVMLESIYIPKGDDFFKIALRKYEDKLIEKGTGWLLDFNNEDILKRKLIEKKISFLYESFKFINPEYITFLKQELYDYKLCEIANFWDEKHFDFVEKASVIRAEVVDSDYGYDVCFFMSDGEHIYIHLSEMSTLCSGDELDMNTAKIVIEFRKGKENICRIIE